MESYGVWPVVSGLISRSMRSARSIPAVAGVRLSFLFEAGEYSIAWIDHVLFSRAPSEGCLCGFRLVPWE